MRAELPSETLLRNPVVLGIPRGGVVVAAAVAEALAAKGLAVELDVVLSRKLHAPGQPELAIGAVAEDDTVVLSPEARAILGGGAALEFQEHLEREVQREQGEILRRRALFGARRLPVAVAGRTVIVVDDGIATGATMEAALRTVASAGAAETVMAVPVGAADRVAQLSRLADRTVCVVQPGNFMAVGQFYDDFRQIEDDEVVRILGSRRCEPRSEKDGD